MSATVEGLVLDTILRSEADHGKPDTLAYCQTPELAFKPLHVALPFRQTAPPPPPPPIKVALNVSALSAGDAERNIGVRPYARQRIEELKEERRPFCGLPARPASEAMASRGSSSVVIW